MSANKVLRKSYLGITMERLAAEAITPGYLIELDSDNKFQKHATAAGSVLPMFAVENDLMGDGIDDDYDSGDTAKAVIPQRGEVIQAIYDSDSGATTVSIGDKLESKGNGELQLHEEGSSGSPDVDAQVVGIALSTADEGEKLDVLII